MKDQQGQCSTYDISSSLRGILPKYLNVLHRRRSTTIPIKCTDRYGLFLGSRWQCGNCDRHLLDSNSDLQATLPRLSSGNNRLRIQLRRSVDMQPVVSIGQIRPTWVEWLVFQGLHTDFEFRLPHSGKRAAGTKALPHWTKKLQRYCFHGPYGCACWILWSCACPEGSLDVDRSRTQEKESSLVMLACTKSMISNFGQYSCWNRSTFETYGCFVVG